MSIFSLPRSSPNPWVLLFALSLSACGQQAETDTPIRITGETMGTTYMVKLQPLAMDLDAREIQSGVEDILNRINRRMSTYLDESELSLFNRASTTDWVTVSAETALVVGEALRISALTGGAFDVTVGPMVNLWGFGPSPQTETVPAESAIQEALSRVGYHRLHVRNEPPAIRKEHPKLQVDLSAIAKGYAVDQLAEYLTSVGVESYLVEVGGELRARGDKAQATPWIVAVERPTSDVKAILRTIKLRDQAMATSGDYRNFFEIEGQRFSHTINPRTGRPVIHDLASVTVLSPSCLEADALATGLMVMGFQAGYEFANREKVLALFVKRTPSGFVQKATPGLAPLLLG